MYQIYNFSAITAAQMSAIWGPYIIRIDQGVQGLFEKKRVQIKSQFLCDINSPTEMQNVKSFTRTNIVKPDFTPRQARKSLSLYYISLSLGFGNINE